MTAGIEKFIIGEIEKFIIRQPPMGKKIRQPPMWESRENGTVKLKKNEI